MGAWLRIALIAAALASAALPALPAHAAAGGASACAPHAQEASRRSGLPVDVILRVMQAESRGRPRAVSHKGAMGCMQIMPQTWTYLTRRYGLGSDPWNPRMNMIGGALYLAEMVAQFGLPGAYSAYNAGPGRYRRHITQGVPLPAETVAYTAHVSGTAPRRVRIPTGPRWQEASLFITPPTAPPAASGSAVPSPDNRTVALPHDSVAPAPAGLFPLEARRRAADRPNDRGDTAE